MKASVPKARPAVHALTTGQKEQTTSFTHASPMPKTEKWEDNVGLQGSIAVDSIVTTSIKVKHATNK